MIRTTCKSILGAVLLAAALAMPFATPLQADTIESKLDRLGKLKYLKVSDLKAVNSDGLLKIQATFENTDNTSQRLFYRFKWLDKDGFKVWDDESWKTTELIGYQKQAIQTVAPTPKATDFRIEMQGPEQGLFGGRAIESKP